MIILRISRIVTFDTSQILVLLPAEHLVPRYQNKICNTGTPSYLKFITDFGTSL